MIRFVRLYGGREGHRLRMEEAGMYVRISKERNIEGVWCAANEEPTMLPAMSATELGDIIAALVHMWEEKRDREVVERTSA